MPENLTIPEAPMQITFENTFDHWAAAHICDMEHRSPLKKDDNKNFIRFICFMLIAAAFFFFTGGPDTGFKIIVIFTVFWILNHFFLRRTQMRKLIYHRLKIGYGQEFEEEKDKTVQWEVTPERIIIRDSDKEIRLSFDSVRKIIVYPMYLYLDLGMGGHATLPRQAVPEADYTAFCDYLINLYRTHARQHQKEAAVIQRDWTIDMAALSAKNSTAWSLKRVFFTVLWGILFLIAGILFFTVLAIAAAAFLISTDLLPYSQEDWGLIMAIGLMIGSALSGILGLLLGLFGKLPGTK